MKAVLVGNKVRFYPSASVTGGVEIAVEPIHRGVVGGQHAQLQDYTVDLSALKAAMKVFFEKNSPELGPATVGKRVQMAYVRVGDQVSTSPSDVDEFVDSVAHAAPMAVIELERHGIKAKVVKDLSRRLGIPASRFYTIIGLPKATAERKASRGAFISGSSGQTAIAMAKLLGVAREILASSTVEGAEKIDAANWLGGWIEQPQPSLGGRKPSELIDTPTGVEVVSRLLGAIQSGAYQ